MLKVITGSFLFAIVEDLFNSPEKDILLETDVKGQDFGESKETFFCALEKKGFQETMVLSYPFHIWITVPHAPLKEAQNSLFVPKMLAKFFLVKGLQF